MITNLPERNGIVGKIGAENLILSEGIVKNFDILESCFDAIDEGVTDPTVITITDSTTDRLFYEILDNVKEALLKLMQRILSALNNYYLNNVKVIERYKEAVKDGLARLPAPLVHETYEYPIVPNYPRELKATVTNADEIVRLHKRIEENDMGPDAVAFEVDHLLFNFGREVLGEGPDPLNLCDSVEKIVTERIRGNGGRLVEVYIDANTVDKYLSEISSYDAEKKDIKETKKNITKDYESLRNTYAKVTKNPREFVRTRAQAIADPEREAFIAHEYLRYKDVHVEMMRLFNGYIDIYNTAFNTKLRELKAKINDRRNTITAIITSVGLFTTLNTKPLDSKRRIIPYQPDFVT